MEALVSHFSPRISQHNTTGTNKQSIKKRNWEVVLVQSWWYPSINLEISCHWVSNRRRRWSCSSCEHPNKHGMHKPTNYKTLSTGGISKCRNQEEPRRHRINGQVVNNSNSRPRRTAASNSLRRIVLMATFPIVAKRLFAKIQDWIETLSSDLIVHSSTLSSRQWGTIAGAESQWIASPN